MLFKDIMFSHISPPPQKKSIYRSHLLKDIEQTINARIHAHDIGNINTETIWTT